MIIINDAVKEAWKTAEAKCEQQLGVKHFSPSSIRDAVECAQKLVFRTRYKNYGLAMECGSAIHAVLALIQEKINESMKERPDDSFEDVRKRVLANVDIPGSFVEIAMKNYEDAQVSALPVLYKDTEQPICIDPFRLNAFFKTVAKYIKPAVLEPLLIDPVKYVELDGYVVYPVEINKERYEIVLYGRQDEISLSADQRLWAVRDIKSTWSSRSNPIVDDGTKFQLWTYKKMLEDHFRQAGMPEAEIKVEVGIKWLKSAFPKNLEDIDKKGLSFEASYHPIKITSADEYRFDQRIRTVVMSVLFGCGIIANSKYGCNYCGYSSVCEYRTAAEDGE